MKKIKIRWKNFKVSGQTYDVLLQMKKDMKLENGDAVIKWMLNEIYRLQGWDVDEPHEEVAEFKPDIPPKQPVIKQEHDVHEDIDKLLEEK